MAGVVCCLLQAYNPQTMPNYIHLHGTQDQEVSVPNRGSLFA